MMMILACQCRHEEPDLGRTRLVWLNNPQRRGERKPFWRRHFSRLCSISV